MTVYPLGMADGDDRKNEESGGDTVTSLSSKLSERLMQCFFESTLRRKLSLLHDSLPFVDNRQERKRRLHLLQEMYVARAKLEDENCIFGLSFVDQGIEAIINGDWVEVRELAEHFNYKHESEIIRSRYAERHAIFCDLLRRAADEALPSDPFTLVVKKGGAWGKKTD